jgi:hypothetical protein
MSFTSELPFELPSALPSVMSSDAEGGLDGLSGSLDVLHPVAGGLVGVASYTATLGNCYNLAADAAGLAAVTGSPNAYWGMTAAITGLAQ